MLSLEKGRIAEAMVPVLVLLAPYFNLLGMDSYRFFTPEALIVGGMITFAGLVAGFLILRGGRIFSSFLVALFVVMFIDFELYWYWANHYIQHILINLALVAFLTWAVMRLKAVAGLILLPIFAVITIVSLATVNFNTSDQVSSPVMTASADDAPRQDTLPLLIHIVLDEHAGLQALDGEYHTEAEALAGAYQDNGFAVYRGAYSQYFKTTTSLGHALNFKQQIDAEIITEILRDKYYDLSENAYFEALLDLGYHLTVTSNDYIGLCQEGQFENLVCLDYKYKNLSVLRKFSLSTHDRAVVIGNVYLSFLNYFIWVKEILRIVLNDGAGGGDVSAEVVGYKPLVFHFPFPLTALNEFDQFESSLTGAGPGDAYFIHLLLPHFPYMLNPDCQPLPLSEWVMYRFSGNPYASNTEATRRLRYTRYLQQVACVNTLIAGLMVRLEDLGLADNAIVIVHGDHGSRITRRDPFYAEVENLMPADYLDAYSTFLAVKLPGQVPQVIDGSISLSAFFAGLVDANFERLPDPLAGDGPQVVYLGDLVSGSYQPAPYPPPDGEDNTEKVAPFSGR